MLACEKGLQDEASNYCDNSKHDNSAIRPRAAYLSLLPLLLCSSAASVDPCSTTTPVAPHSLTRTQSAASLLLYPVAARVVHPISVLLLNQPSHQKYESNKMRSTWQPPRVPKPKKTSQARTARVSFICKPRAPRLCKQMHR